MKEIKKIIIPPEKLKPLYKDAKELVFGRLFTDYMFIMEYTREKGWFNPEIKPYGPIPLEPSAGVFHFVSKERLALDYLYSRSYSQGISDSYSHIRSAIVCRRDAKDIIYSWLFPPLRLFRLFSPSYRRKYYLQKIICKGTHAGYRFHQQEVARDEELKKWVLQETYW